MVAVRSDLLSAFPSLRWRSVLESDAARALDGTGKTALTAIYSHFSPEGLGVPVGLPTSPAILDLACTRFDIELAKLGDFAARYVDDVLLLGQDVQMGQRFSSLVDRELGAFGLNVNTAKTSLHSSNGFLEKTRGSLEVKPFPVSFLGHEIHSYGLVDVSAKTIARLELKTEDERLESRGAFALAVAGPRYAALFSRGAKAEEGDDLEPPQQLQRTPLWGARVAIDSALVETDRGRVVISIGGGITTTKVHPKLSLDGSPKIGLQNALDDCAEGDGRGGRGIAPRPPRSKRSPLLDQHAELVGGRLGLLRLAEIWNTNWGHSRTVEFEAGVLFGCSTAKVQQFARAAHAWRLAKIIIETSGVALAPSREEAIIRRIWPVLMAAATLTVIDAVRVVVADPIDEILRYIRGASTADCKARINAERAARAAGRPATLPSRWGRLTMHESDLQRSLFRQPPVLIAKFR